jgi:hypothetical protein
MMRGCLPCLLLFFGGCFFDSLGPDVRAFHECWLNSTLSVPNRDIVFRATCEVPSPWVFVALPARQVSEEDLKNAGLAPELSDLVGRDQMRNHWCLARTVPHDPQAPQEGKTTTARSTCSDARVTIDTLLFSQSGTVTFVFRRTGDQPSLMELEVSR